MTSLAGAFDKIDWNRPWLALYRDTGVAILCNADRLAALNRHAAAHELRNHRMLSIRFVPQSELPPDTSYEAFISATGCVPTRDNLHDFFNGLAWLVFPRIKAELNRLQAAHIAASGIGQARGATRDAATIFDENAALLITRDASLEGSLRAHEWRRIFLQQRTAFTRDAETWLFGHALLEKLVSPYKAITAHAWILPADDRFFGLPARDKIDWVDRTVALRLAQTDPATADFTPLPVLGVPGWWSSQDESFYGDGAVFRPKREHRSE
jgi:hypothetical protein